VFVFPDADKWTLSISAEEYVRMLEFLLRMVRQRLGDMKFGQVPTPAGWKASESSFSHNHTEGVRDVLHYLTYRGYACMRNA
jgi:hypothetical protein